MWGGGSGDNGKGRVGVGVGVPLRDWGNFSNYVKHPCSLCETCKRKSSDSNRTSLTNPVVNHPIELDTDWLSSSTLLYTSS